MTSPLFKTLSIASLRYWSETCNVVATYIYKNASFLIDRNPKVFESKPKVYNFVRQNRRFDLNLQKVFDFENITKRTDYDLC